MIDATTDVDYAALERRDAQAAPRVPVRRRAPGTLASLPSAPTGPSEGAEAASVTETVAVTASAAHAPPDPMRHLQTARLGFALAAILICYWLWMRRRRY